MSFRRGLDESFVPMLVPCEDPYFMALREERQGELRSEGARPPGDGVYLLRVGQFLFLFGNIGTATERSIRPKLQIVQKIKEAAGIAPAAPEERVRIFVVYDM